jgi:hypothetical protein
MSAETCVVGRNKSESSACVYATGTWRLQACVQRRVSLALGMHCLSGWLPLPGELRDNMMRTTKLAPTKYVRAVCCVEVQVDGRRPKHSEADYIQPKLSLVDPSTPVVDFLKIPDSLLLQTSPLPISAGRPLARSLALPCLAFAPRHRPCNGLCISLHERPQTGLRLACSSTTYTHPLVSQHGRINSRYACSRGPSLHLAHADTPGQPKQEPHATRRLRSSRRLLQCHEAGSHTRPSQQQCPPSEAAELHISNQTNRLRSIRVLRRQGRSTWQPDTQERQREHPAISQTASAATRSLP